MRLYIYHTDVQCHTLDESITGYIPSWQSCSVHDVAIFFPDSPTGDKRSNRC